MPLQLAGWLCILFGVADLGLFLAADIDPTGVSWSSHVAFLLGSVLLRAGGGDDE